MEKRWRDVNMKKNKELERINDHIKKLFNEWKALQPLKPKDQERFDKKTRLEWNYHSNHIEGNTLTYNETKALLNEGKEEGIHPPRDYKEIKAHDLAINKIRKFAKDKERKLNEVTIRDLNQIILKEPFWKEAVTSDGQKTKKKIFPGQYKTHPNHVITEEGCIFKFAEPLDVPIKMQELMDWFHKEMKNPSLSIASFLAELHHRFIVIHPFDDGNGRITRLWINYVLLRFGYPPLVIKSEDKRNYFAALQRADNIDIDSLAVYLGKALISWLEIGIKAAKGEDISEMGDVDKEVDLFIREQKSKELNKYFSKESAINLIDNLSEVLFETFKNKFKRFDELFDSTEIKQTIVKPNVLENQQGWQEWHGLPKSPPKLWSRDFENKEDIKDYLQLSSDDLIFQSVGRSRICVKLVYEEYRHEYGRNLEEPFSMDAYLSIEINEFKYNINITSSSYYHKVYIENKKPNENEFNRHHWPLLPIDRLFPQQPFNKKYKKETLKKSEFINIERYYNQLLTQKEVDVFIEQGQKEFLKLLKSATGKDADDKK